MHKVMHLVTFVARKKKFTKVNNALENVLLLKIAEFDEFGSRKKRSKVSQREKEFLRKLNISANKSD